VLLRVFTKFDQHTIIWQLDASKEYLVNATIVALKKPTLPDHIHVFHWLPSLKSLMADSRVKLLVTHGGFTSSIEAFNMGIPVMCTAIHSDQAYNAQRFAEKGLGEYVRVSQWNEKILFGKMAKILKSYSR
jgi:glucuronosyltransferase